ncbi:MAG: hypothetical protein ACOX6L_10890, partial [Syntrophomonadaceae bacterium]
PTPYIIPQYPKVLNTKMENLTKKLALFGLLKDFSFIQLSKTRAAHMAETARELSLQLAQFKV